MARLSMKNLTFILYFGPVALLLGSCGSSREVKARPDDPTYLEEGIITFHDPAPRPGVTRSNAPKLPALTMVITTMKSPLNQGDGSQSVMSGRINQNQRLSEKEVAAGLFGIARQQGTLVSSARFAKVWDQLVDAGILNLQRHSGNKPPAKQAWIQVDAGSQKWIFLRPDDSNIEQKSQAEQARINSWLACKLVMVEATN